MNKNIYIALGSRYPQVGGPNVVCNYNKYLRESGNDYQIIAPNYGKRKDETADNGTGIKVMRSSGYTFRSAVFCCLQTGKEIA